MSSFCHGCGKDITLGFEQVIFCRDCASKQVEAAPFTFTNNARDDILAVIANLQRMTSGNVSHIRDNCIGSLRSVIALAKERAALNSGAQPPQADNRLYAAIEHLRYLFYYRLPTGDKLESLMHDNDNDFDRWKSIHSLLNGPQ